MGETQRLDFTESIDSKHSRTHKLRKQTQISAKLEIFYSLKIRGVDPKRGFTYL